ncbi:hypothetical protein [Micromonospora cremea]|uniref:hypothetical protein n=1 Tax=Micromonospora cremea TaxID=709881 RepID=UPI0013564CF5|nr:hypothetical protein [Micromonospora cremea]
MRKSDKKSSSSQPFARVRLRWMAAAVVLAVVATTGPATSDNPDPGPAAEPSQ